jgi:hypothetical protein
MRADQLVRVAVIVAVARGQRRGPGGLDVVAPNVARRALAITVEQRGAVRRPDQAAEPVRVVVDRRNNAAVEIDDLEPMAIADAVVDEVSEIAVVGRPAQAAGDDIEARPEQSPVVGDDGFQPQTESPALVLPSADNTG